MYVIIKMCCSSLGHIVNLSNKKSINISKYIRLPYLKTSKSHAGQKVYLN